MTYEFGNMASYGYPTAYICVYCGHLSYTLADAQYHTKHCEKHPINKTCYSCMRCGQPCPHKERMPMWHCKYWENPPSHIVSVFDIKEIL